LLLDRKLRVAEKGHKKGRETCPFYALDGFNEIRLTALKRNGGDDETRTRDLRRDSPPRAVFIAPHQLGMHSLRLALRRSGNYSLTDCLSDFGPASLRVHPGHNFLVARDTIRIIETPRYVPYWNGRSDGKSRPARGARSGGAAVQRSAAAAPCQAAESALIVR
jgi:hypothetical protein